MQATGSIPSSTDSAIADFTTIPEVLRATAKRYPDKLALRQPGKEGVRTWTWSQYLETAE